MPHTKVELTGQPTPYREQLEKLRIASREADRVMVGAGAGLSTAAGFLYSGERFDRYFSDFREEYAIPDMYSGGFYPFPDAETRWAWWSRHIYVNRYMDPPKPLYRDLLDLVRDKDYFVLTTNVDHCFQKAGVERERLFYTQGDYGLFQCSKPCHHDTYDNGDAVRAMVLAQGFAIGEDGSLLPPENGETAMRIPSALAPRCPRCGRPMTTNLRADDRFVEDAGWYIAQGYYERFAAAALTGKTLYLELGVGYNTPGIIKYPFWRWTAQNPRAVYACVNVGEAVCPKEIEGQSICIDEDIGKVIADLGAEKR